MTVRERRLLIASLAAVVVAELIGVRRRNRATISALTADLFHVETPHGRLAFTTVWVAFAAWFGRHIWRSIRAS